MKYIINKEGYQLLDYHEWERKYKPIEKSEGNILFETHDGKDIVFLRKFIKENSVLHIWTLVDGDDGDLFIDSGIRWVNRLNYIVTEIPRESEDILVQSEY